MSFFLANKDNASLAKWYEETFRDPVTGMGWWRPRMEERQSRRRWLYSLERLQRQRVIGFLPSPARFMINYRVDNLEALIAKLTAAGIDILEGPQYHENGIFAWIVDPEENKVELWEPMIWDEKNKR